MRVVGFAPADQVESLELSAGVDERHPLMRFGKREGEGGGLLEWKVARFRPEIDTVSGTGLGTVQAQSGAQAEAQSEAQSHA